MLMSALTGGVLVAASAVQGQAVTPALDPGPIVKDTNFIRTGQVKFAGEQVRMEGAGLPAGNRAFIVIDLKGVRQFNTLRLFQMFSDGKVTDAALSTSSTYGDNWPMFDDGSWTEVVPRSAVTAGAESGGIGTCPTVFGFTPATARYVRLDLWNTGSFGGGNYVEIAGAKLMYEDAAPTTEQSCPPAAPTAVSASYAEGNATVTWTPPTGAT